jgi:hypothetical protein
MALDKETLQHLHRVKECRSFVNATGWEQAKQELALIVAELSDIDNLPSENVEFTVAVRKEVVRIMRDWVLTLESHALSVPDEETERDYIIDKSVVE